MFCPWNCTHVWFQLEQLRQSEKCNFYILTNASSFCLGSCGLLILYVHSTILPNSISHTRQVKSEPDEIYPYQREEQWRQGQETWILTERLANCLTNTATFENLITSEFSICNRQRCTHPMKTRAPNHFHPSLPPGRPQANFNPKNMLTHSSGEFWARAQKALALMTVNAVGKYSILSLWLFFFLSWGSDLTQ